MMCRVKALSEINDMAACSYICPSKITNLIYLIQKHFLHLWCRKTAGGILFRVLFSVRAYRCCESPLPVLQKGAVGRKRNQYIQVIANTAPHGSWIPVGFWMILDYET